MNFLQDQDFLDKIYNTNIRATLCKITILDFKEKPIQSIEGLITAGNISVNGNSAVRRTLNLTMIASQNQNNDLTNVDNLISINKKIKVEVGMVNPYKIYDSILWFPQGIYVISTANISHSLTNCTINITGQDKMCMLNGTVGGTLPSTVIFDTYYKEEGDTIVLETLPLYQIIVEAVNHYGQEDLSNIYVNDLPEFGQQILQYNGKDPIYFSKNYSSFSFNYSLNHPIPVYRGELVGYKTTPLTWPTSSELVLNAGDNVASLLDKIAKILGNFEYFYDINGKFHFQEIKNYKNIGNDSLYQLDNTAYFQNYGLNQYKYDFTDLSKIISISNNPKFENIKNDFLVWGVNDAGFGIRYHVCIAEKPNENMFNKYLLESDSEVVAVNKEAIDIVNSALITFSQAEINDIYKVYGISFMNYFDQPEAIKGLANWHYHNEKEYEAFDPYNNLYTNFILDTELNQIFKENYTPNHEVILFEGKEWGGEYPNKQTQVISINPQIKTLRSLFADNLDIGFTFETFAQFEYLNLYFFDQETEQTSDISLYYQDIEEINNKSTFSFTERIFNQLKIKYSDQFGNNTWNNLIKITIRSMDDTISKVIFHYLGEKGPAEIIQYPTVQSATFEWREELYRQALLKQKDGTADSYVDAELLAEWRKLYNPEFQYWWRWKQEELSKPGWVYNNSSSIKPYYVLKEKYANLTIAEMAKIKGEKKLDYIDFYELNRDYDGKVYSNPPDFQEEIKKNGLYSWNQILTHFDSLGSTAYFYYNSPWTPAIEEDPSTIKYWLDYIDLPKYSIESIGRRNITKNNEKVNILWRKESPNNLFIENDGDYQEEINYAIKHGYNWFLLSPNDPSLFVVDSGKATALDEIRLMIQNQLSYNTGISITTLPYYHMEPNSLIQVKDKATGVNNRYLMTQFTIPLAYNGTMSITANEIIDSY